MNIQVDSMIRDTLAFTTSSKVKGINGVIGANNVNQIHDEEVAMMAFYSNVTSLVALNQRCFDVDVILNEGVLELQICKPKGSTILPEAAVFICIESWSEILKECNFNLTLPLQQIKALAGTYAPLSPLDDFSVAKDYTNQKASEMMAKIESIRTLKQRINPTADRRVS
ncbi:MAG: hypothetical protein U9N57_14220 [Pseudomonadota bacterium]|nr:hypothetical protein [Pseudomonadota bacterium]